MFKEITTIEKLQGEVSCSYGVVVQYGSWVFVADLCYKGGFVAAVYEFVDTEADGFSAIECRLQLVKSETECMFTDNGHAIEWCMKEVVK